MLCLVWKGMERTPSAVSILRYCIHWSGMEGSGSGCAFPLVPDQPYGAVAICSIRYSPDRDFSKTCSVSCSRGSAAIAQPQQGWASPEVCVRSACGGLRPSSSKASLCHAKLKQRATANNVMTPSETLAGGTYNKVWCSREDA